MRQLQNDLEKIGSFYQNHRSNIPPDSAFTYGLINNGLFRQYFPKGSDFSILSDADVQRVEDKLNSRPRKILGYQTPREIFFSARNLPVALHC